MSNEVLSLMRKLYQYTQERAFNLYKKNKFIENLYNISKRNIDNSSTFFKYLKRLYDFNQRRGIHISRKNRYISFLMTECEKEVKRIKENSVKEPEPEQDENSNNVKKAAVLIGINYRNNNIAPELFGCENDVDSMKNLLIDQFGLQSDNILVLTERDRNNIPTRDNVLKALQWLVDKSNDGFNSLLFHYSGHGFYFRDNAGDEIDGYDECLITSDNYAILDDELNRSFISKINEKSKLFCLVDCCHSGTMLDLEYKYLPSRDVMKKEISNRVRANVITLSGCKDWQLSADANFREGGWAGAMTKNFLKVLKDNDYSPKLNVLVNEVNTNLRSQRFRQIPQLCSSKEISPDQKFSL